VPKTINIKAVKEATASREQEQFIATASREQEQFVTLQRWWDATSRLCRRTISKISYKTVCKCKMSHFCNTYRDRLIVPIGLQEMQKMRGEKYVNSFQWSQDHIDI
jgi:hypothetical protein